METQVLPFLLVSFFSWIAVVIAFKLLTGGIAVEGVFSSSTNGSIELDRVQLLVAAIAGAGAYAFVGLQTIGDGTERLPEIPEFLVAAYGGSQLIYLMGKTLRKPIDFS